MLFFSLLYLPPSPRCCLSHCGRGVHLVSLGIAQKEDELAREEQARKEREEAERKRQEELERKLQEERQKKEEEERERERREQEARRQREEERERQRKLREEVISLLLFFLLSPSVVCVCACFSVRVCVCVCLSFLCALAFARIPWLTAAAAHRPPEQWASTRTCPPLGTLPWRSS